MYSNCVKAAVLIAATALVAACSGSTPTSPSVATTVRTAGAAPATTTGVAGPASAPAPSQATANYEIKFMEGMIDHHQMAVMMAEMCLDKAIHPELEAMCSNIIATQSAEIDAMQSWLQSWYGISYEPAMNGGGAMQHLSRLSGEEFEVAFMEMMIRHHEAAVREGEMCQERAYHPELITLCENIVPTQSAEIEQMETWLCQWYGRCS